MSAPRRPGRPSSPIPTERLVAIARTVFSDEGYAGASMRQIAERAGIRKASLFHRFPRKEDLYEAAIGGVLDDLAAILRDVATTRVSFPERLDLLGASLVGYLGQHPEAARLLLREIVGGGQLSHDPKVGMTLAATSAFLDAGVAAGAVPPQDTRQLALSLVGLHLTLFAAREVSSGLLGADVFSDEMVAERIVVVQKQVRALCGVATK